jgi:TRAP transporter TAXI family solute receptor
MINKAFLARFRLPTLFGVLIAIETGLATDLPLAVRVKIASCLSRHGPNERVHYPVGKAIEIVNRDLRTHSVRCSPEVTPGAVYNTGAIQSGELEFGIIQSDVQFAAYKGQGVWTGKPFLGLRSVLSLYQELATVIARADSRIQDLAGLAGRRVNVGSPGTGTRATWDAIEAELGWRDAERVRPIELRAGCDPRRSAAQRSMPAC